jgi:drug/metabolite transporter (DMT)-like permease
MNKRIKKMSWILFAFGAMIFLTLMFLLEKKVLTLGVGSGQLLFYINLVVAVMVFIFLLSTKESIKINFWMFALIALIGLFAFLGNYLLLKSINVSPNPGFSLAIAGVHVLLVTIISIFLFKSDFTWTKIVGTIFAVIGVILLGWKG